ncbi:MAG: tetratricopeptide repeat protein [Saprospirales bacterium]|nr:tetratricopeptide repeat protein [Saprospirales bacterium]
MKNVRIVLFSLAALLLAAGCVTTKKKGAEPGWFKKGYHNLTSKYNYWFNADELLTLSIATLEKQHTDNYSQILALYPYAATEPQPVLGDLDNVIKKSAMAIGLHRISEFTDDCYTMMGQAQYLKRDFETAEATFKYIRDEYNPNNKSKSKIKSDKKKKETIKKKKKKPSKKKRKKASSRKKKKKSDKPEEKAKEKPEEPVIQRDDPYDKSLQRTAAFPLAMIWYGRTLTEREKYDEAIFLYRELHEDPFFPPELRQELSMAETYLWLKQKHYEKAVAPLELAIQQTDRKKERARLAYILSQLYERAGQYDKAYATLEIALNSHPAYEMEFNARIRLIQTGWAHGKINSAEANKALERMAKDAKNTEYRDQIYFIMADIAIKDGLRNDAIALLRKSLDVSQGNANQRGESYLRLADLYFETEDFVSAKKYFDSTLTVLAATDERHPRVQNYAQNLTDIARLITTITTNDSIIRVYYMPDTERKELAKKIKKQREEEARQAAAAPAPPAGPAKSLPIPGAGAAKPASAFYFYNDAFLKKGKKDFSKTWGERKLEDNWRRSTRPASGGPGDLAGSDSLQANAISDAELTDIFQGIPRSDAELAVLHSSTYEAMYHLGVLFRDRLQNNKRCTGTLEDMQTRYPDTTKYEKEAWYYCYLAFKDLGNAGRAQYYLDKLIDKYPNSPFARAITDPNFMNANKERERELNQFYEQTYSYFQKGDYKSAFERCQEAPKKYGSTNPLMAKFALLSALCTGNLQGKEPYCAALKEVIARYPESSESTRAKEIARLLSCPGFEVEATPLKGSGNTAAPDDAFTLDDDKLHYFLVAISGGDVRLDDVKIAGSDYNREYHKLDQLRISNIFLGTDTNLPIVVIRKFDNKEQVMRYYQEVSGRREFLGETDKKTYKKEFFAISQENYRRILKNKTLDGYREFFEEHYLQK